MNTEVSKKCAGIMSSETFEDEENQQREPGNQDRDAGAEGCVPTNGPEQTERLLKVRKRTIIKNFIGVVDSNHRQELSLQHVAVIV